MSTSPPGGRPTTAEPQRRVMTLIDPKLRQALTGISGILVTPFDDRDEVAPHRLAGIIDREGFRRA